MSTPQGKTNLFYVRRIDRAWYVVSTYHGITSEGHDCPGFAEADADERRADWEAAEAEETAAAGE